MGGKTKTSYKIGQSGNPKGRPQGSSEAAKDWWDNFFDKDRPLIKCDWKKISPSLRMQLRFKYLEFQIPKLRSEHLDLNLDSMSDQLAGQIISTILQNKLIDENHEVKFRSPDGRGDDMPTDNT